MNYVEKLLVALVIKITVWGVLGSEIKSVRPKIVGGHDVEIREVPFLLGLHLEQVGIYCGAVIVSTFWALSAHHCVHPDYPEPENYFVRAGSTRLNAGGQIRRVKKFYFYDSEYHFDGRSIPPHDIILLRMSKRFRFSDTVRPAKLPPAGNFSPKWLRVCGWGETGEFMHSSNDRVLVRAANVTRVEWKDCVETSPWYESLVDDKKHLCYGGAGPDACHGDSGGPLADTRTVYGIVSFGDGCGVVPGVYSKVSFYRRWIKRITKM